MPSVLDTFYILFKSDASEVEQGTKKAKGATDKLEESVGGVDKTTTDLGKKFNKLATQAVAAFGAVFAVNKLISGATATAATATNLRLLGAVFGENTADIVSWGRAVEGVGGTQEAFQASLLGMNTALTDAAVGIPSEFTNAINTLLGPGAFAKIKEEGKTVLDFLPEIAKALQGFSRQGQLKFAGMLGMDVGLLQLLKLGPEEVKRRVDIEIERNLISGKENIILSDLDIRAGQLGDRFSDVFDQFIVDIEPELNLILGALEEFIVWAEGALGELVIDLRAAVALIKLITGNADDPKTSPKSRAPWVQDVFDTVEGNIETALEEGRRGLASAESAARSISAGAQTAHQFATEGRGAVTRIMNVSGVVIETMATDAAGIGRDFVEVLEKEYANAIDNSDDGLIP